MPASKNFVVFYSPGTIVSESTEKEIDQFDTVVAVEMAKGIRERHGVTPFGFRFFTRTMNEKDFTVKTEYKPGTYFLGGKLLSLDDIPDTKENEILRDNMRYNDWQFVIENTNSWKITLPFNPNKDTLLEF